MPDDSDVFFGDNELTDEAAQKIQDEIERGNKLIEEAGDIEVDLTPVVYNEPDILGPDNVEAYLESTSKGLWTTREQLDHLMRVNYNMPDECKVSGTLLSGLTPNSKVRQRLDRLEVVFVTFASESWKTYYFNEKLLQLSFPNLTLMSDVSVRSYLSADIMSIQADMDRSKGLIVDQDKIEEKYPSSHKYLTPGIYIVTLNLFDYWAMVGMKKQTIRSIYTRLGIENKHNATKKEFAGVEIYSALALQPKWLTLKQNGTKLPYYNLAGIRYGKEFEKVPTLTYANGSCGPIHFNDRDFMQIGLVDITEPNTGFSNPTVLNVRQIASFAA